MKCCHLPEADAYQLELDKILYGSSAVLRCDCGRKHRLHPYDVEIIKDTQPSKDDRNTQHFFKTLAKTPLERECVESRNSLSNNKEYSGGQG